MKSIVVGLLLSGSVAFSAPNVVVWGSASSKTPQEVTNNIPSDLTNAVMIAGGYDHVVALRADGTVSCWGRDTYGQCDVPLGLTNVIQVVAGSNCTAVVCGDGTVKTWGTLWCGLNPNSDPNVYNTTDAIEAALNPTNLIILHADGCVHTSIGDCTTGLSGMTNVDCIIGAPSANWMAGLCDGCITNGGSMGGNTYTNPMCAVQMSCSTSYAACLHANGTVAYWNPSAGSVTNSPLTNIVALAVGYPIGIGALDGDGKVKLVVGGFMRPTWLPPFKALAAGYTFGIGILK